MRLLPRPWRRRRDQQQQQEFDDGSIGDITTVVFALDELPGSFLLGSARGLDRESRVGPEIEERCSDGLDDHGS